MCVSLMYIYMTQNLALKFIRKDHFTQKLQFYNTMLFAEITFVAFYFHNICLFVSKITPAALWQVALFHPVTSNI